MDRRTFLGLVSGSLLAAPVPARAQQARKVARIGIISVSIPVVLFAGAEPSNPAMAAVLYGRQHLGYIYGRDSMRPDATLGGATSSDGTA